MSLTFDGAVSVNGLAASATAPLSAGGAAAAKAPDFMERMGEALKDLAENQSKAAAASRAYELGERQDLAGVMVEQQVASLGFQLTLNVRNRALTAYRDIMNMSV
ncbi:MAG: flagellar hook-basal body complex protein FliE [Gemmobacter sp.]|nr:flagellar hook-basal body complex protein FliE [Gemmobacter sp.]